MKKRDFIQLVLTGISGGMLVTNPLSAHNISQTSSKNAQKAPEKPSEKTYDPNDGNMNYHVMSEDELLLELSSEGVTMYKSLTPDGKALALLVASAMCNGTNECSGLNACKTEKNECAGKGSCKGTGKCAFSDKNLAVKVVKDKMSGKRANAVKPKT